MMELNYKAIKAYIQEEKQVGDKMVCQFVIEEKVFESEAVIEKLDKMDHLSQMVSSSKLGGMRSMMARVLKKAVKGKTKSSNTEEKSMHFGKIEKELAVVRAFEEIMDEIIYIETTGNWHLAEEFSEFERRIRQNPLTKIIDKKIMSRMLVEMARADGRIQERERLFFDHFLNDETGRLSELIRASLLKVGDFEKVSKEGRETIYMVVVAVALTDNDFDDKEKEKLAHFAKMFGFDSKQQAELLLIAQDYTIEMAVKAKKRKLSMDELFALADKIEMDREDAKKSQDQLSF